MWVVPLSGIHTSHTLCRQLKQISCRDNVVTVSKEPSNNSLMLWSFTSPHHTAQVPCQHIITRTVGVQYQKILEKRWYAHKSTAYYNCLVLLFCYQSLIVINLWSKFYHDYVSIWNNSRAWHYLQSQASTKGPGRYLGRTAVEMKYNKYDTRRHRKGADKY